MRIGVLSNNVARRYAVFAGCAGHEIVIMAPESDFSKYDLVILAGWPEILKKDRFAAPKHGTWNCHGGPVPEYRGGSPLNWQIIDGQDVIGVSLLQVDEGIDTGNVLGTGKFHLTSGETIREAHDRANTCFAHLIREALKKIPDPGLRQPESKAYRRQRCDDDGRIDLSWEPKRIHDFVRALTHPYPGAWVESDGTRLRIWSTSLESLKP